MKVCFVALAVPVLNMTYERDRAGVIIPPDCFAEFKDVVPVTYGGGTDEDQEEQVGHARLYRKGDTVYGDFTLFSTWGEDARALTKIRRLRPAASLNIRQAVGDTYFHVQIEYVIVTPHENHDPKITPFGERMLKRPKKADMN